MQLNRPFRQPTITSFLKKQPNLDFSQMLKKHEIKNNAQNNNGKNQTRLYPFSYKSPSPSMSPSQTHSRTENNDSKSPSPSPSTMLANLDLKHNHNPIIKYTNSNRSKKRKLQINDTSIKTNCLKKVILSDGSVCYTMVDQQIQSSSTFNQPPQKKMRPNSFQHQSSSILSQQNTKKRPNSCFTSNTNTTQYNKPQIKRIHKATDIGNTKKQAIVYSESMPAPTKPNEEINSNKKRRRRHSHNEHWTSKDNLLASLEKQESILEDIFPSHIPTVNLEEIFDGQQFIRVHKKIRPINLRRETQFFARPQI